MKFKIGDRVERIKSVFGVDEHPVGSLGIVENVAVRKDGEAWSVDVLFDGFPIAWGCIPDTLRIVPDEVEKIDLVSVNLLEVL